MTTIDTASLTPEGIIGAAKRHGLRLIPGDYLTYDGRRIVGCCPLGALAIEARPRILKGEVPFFPEFLGTIGLDLDLRGGISAGFDGEELGPDFDWPLRYRQGYALGRATRLAAGIDDAEGPQAP